MLRALPEAADVAALVARTCQAPTPRRLARDRARSAPASRRYAPASPGRSRHEHAHVHADMLPRGTLVLATGLVLFALAATTLVRITGTPPAASPVACAARSGIAPVATRDLRFLDRADGSVLIEDAGTGGTAAVIEAGARDRLHPRRDARPGARAALAWVRQ